MVKATTLTDIPITAATMDAERGTSFVVMFGGTGQLMPSYFLFRFTKVDTQESTYCIGTNTGGRYGPIVVSLAETGETSPDPFDAEVQLGAGDHQMDVWEQTSSSNLFPPDADPKHSELLRSWTNEEMPDPPYVDPCVGCGGGACPYNGIIQIDGVQVGTFGPFDPCEDNTLNIILQ